MKVKLTVQDPAGIHARPAAQLAIALAKTGATVTLQHQGRTADARSVIQLLALGALAGSELEAEIQGTQQQQAEALQVLQDWAS